MTRKETGDAVNYIYVIYKDGEKVATYKVFHNAYLGAINMSRDNNADVELLRYTVRYDDTKYRDKQFYYRFVNGRYAPYVIRKED